MSTLRVSNIQDTSGGNSSTPAAIANGIAKAWVNFNGTGTVATRSSYNVSSITDNGVGDYTVNFTTAFANTSYTPVLTTAYFFSSSTTYANNRGTFHPVTFNTGSLRVVTGWDTSNLDHVFNTVSVFA